MSETQLQRELATAKAKLEPGQRDYKTAALELVRDAEGGGEAAEAAAVLPRSDS